MTEKKTIVEWVKGLLRKNAPELDSLPEPPGERLVTNLINRASGDSEEPKGEKRKLTPDSKHPDEENDKHNGGNDKEGSGENNDGGEKRGCSYAIKRNIVQSLQEIRRFAEEHDLAGTMIRALLMLLAEMALGALKGKVSSNVLDMLLKIFNYEQAVSDAYRRGEKAGRNAGIEREFFPDGTDGLPHFRGLTTRKDSRPDIFAIAEES